MFKTKEIPTGKVSLDSRNAYFNPLGSCFSSSFGIVILEGRALFSLLGSSSLQENRSTATKPFVAQKSQFRRLMYQATK